MYTDTERSVIIEEERLADTRGTCPECDDEDVELTQVYQDSWHWMCAGCAEVHNG